jgi:hypothetical protein
MTATHRIRLSDTPRVDWRFAATCALTPSLLFAVQKGVASDNVSFGLIFERQAIIWGTWLALTPWIIRTARHHPFGAETRARWLGRQLVIGGGFSILHSVLPLINLGSR